MNQRQIRKHFLFIHWTVGIVILYINNFIVVLKLICYILVNRSSKHLNDEKRSMTYNRDIASKNEVSKSAKTTQENFSNNKKYIPMASKNRTETSSPYDNLFLDGPSSKSHLTPCNKYNDNSVLVENHKNAKHNPTAFIKYGENNEIERSQNGNINDDEYTSDDSVYQSEENQSTSSADSTSPSHQKIVHQNMRLPNDNKRNHVKRKTKRKHQNTEMENRPRIEMAVRRSTASIMDSRLSPTSQSSKQSNNICPIHDESDFIGKLLYVEYSALSFFTIYLLYICHCRL